MPEKDDGSQAVEPVADLSNPRETQSILAYILTIGFLLVIGYAVAKAIDLPGHRDGSEQSVSARHDGLWRSTSRIRRHSRLKPLRLPSPAFPGHDRNGGESA